jgi:acyl-CoA thioester hydrolase
MKPPRVPLEKILALGPPCFEMTVPEEYRDQNGHMNMRWYLGIFDDAGDRMYLTLGLTPEYHRAHGTGSFDLEHHLHFLSEVMPADRLAVYARFVGLTAKRMHYLLFMVNETRGALASIFECVNSFADLSTRKTAPYPPDIAATIAARVAAHSRLDWPPPVCGAMHA